MRNQYFFTVESVGIEFHSRNVLGTRRKRRAKCRHLSPSVGCADCAAENRASVPSHQPDFCLASADGTPAAFFTTTATRSAARALAIRRQMTSMLMSISSIYFDLLRSSSPAREWFPHPTTTHDHDRKHRIHADT